MPSPTPASPVTSPWWRKLRVDGFLVAIILAAIVGTLIPARGPAIGAVDWTGTILIGVLFFLYGTRLSPKDTWTGIKNWRLHGLVFGFTFVLFPMIGLLFGWLTEPLLGSAMAMGLLYLTLCPSTVQSSVNFTSVAGGNVAGAVVSASVSNLAGVVVTPLLAMLLIGSLGVAINPSSIISVAINVLAPYLLGQLLRRRTLGFVLRHKRLRLVDQSSIVVIVYGAFGDAMRTNIWSQTSATQLVTLLAVLSVILTLMLVLTWQAAGWVGLPRADRITVQMCGTKKSLMTGLPMATVIFAGSELPLGLVALPLMAFHQIQLMVCGALAGRYARRTRGLAETGAQAPSHQPPSH